MVDAAVQQFSMAAAIAEQSAAPRDIAVSIQEASAGVGETRAMAREIAAVNQATSRIGDGSEHVLAGATGLFGAVERVAVSMPLGLRADGRDSSMATIATPSTKGSVRRAVRDQRAVSRLPGATALRQTESNSARSRSLSGAGLGLGWSSRQRLWR